MTSLVLSIWNGSYLFLQVTRSTIKAWMGLIFGKIPSLTSELAALEPLKNQWMGLKFSQIGPWTVELGALELPEKIPIDL